MHGLWIGVSLWILTLNLHGRFDMPNYFPVHYDPNIKIGDKVRIVKRVDIYDEIYPDGEMSFGFGISRFDEYEHTTSVVLRLVREVYCGKAYMTYHVLDIPYVFPPWLLEKVNPKSSWEV
jgi:hypothetical protein